jgi:hypothetical protein
MLRLLLALVISIPLLGCSDDAVPVDGGPQPETSGPCSPANCTGCCLGSQCRKGDEAAACGTAGLNCVSCPDGESCVAGQCLVASGKCNATNCPDGCCKGDQCVSGKVDDACGQGGRVCVDCGSSSKCIKLPPSSTFRCDCDPATCPGCCEAGVCKPGNDRAACGKGGDACKACKGNEICSSSTRTCKETSGCDPSNCSGCCDGPECRSGLANENCGVGGSACKTCGASENCTKGICNDPASCGPGSCSGCCAGSSCQSGKSRTQCGGNGGLCTACADHEKCVAPTGCELDNDKLWGITVGKATLDPNKGWDTWPANSAPDVYIEIEIGTVTAKTSQKDNEYNPVWNEYIGKIKAGTLLNVPLEVKILDNDSPFGPETIGSCNVTIPLNVLISGNDAFINACGTYVTKLTFKFTPA